MNEKLGSDEFRSQIIFASTTLGPLFLNDPSDEGAREILKAISQLDPCEAGAEWPFVDTLDAQGALSLMVEGLEEGIDSEGLIWEYRRLFVGPARKPAPPWGSVYTDRECVIFGESTLALRRWMRSNDIERSLDEETPDDHIGLMLMLLAWLIENKPELVESYLKGHLLTWSSHFLDSLSEAAEQSFYEGLALLAKLTLEGLQVELALEVEYPRYYR